METIGLIGVGLLGLHLNHGFWSAARTLGVAGNTVRTVGAVLAVVITGGFLAVPIGVMTGLVA